MFDELKKKAEESIYTWEPKYDIHKETFTVDSEATEVIKGQWGRIIEYQDHMSRLRTGRRPRTTCTRPPSTTGWPRPGPTPRGASGSTTSPGSGASSSCPSWPGGASSSSSGRPSSDTPGQGQLGVDHKYNFPLHQEVCREWQVQGSHQDQRQVGQP